MGNKTDDKTERESTLGKLKFGPLEEGPQKFGELSDDEVEKIRLEVHEQVQDERKKLAKEELKKKLLAEARRTTLPGQEEYEITMDLPGHMDRITIDMGHYPNGGVYFHGMKYKVDANKYATLMEMVMRAWAHEEETGIPNHRTYRRPKNLAIGNFFDPALNGTRQEREVRIGPKDL
jgi:hypothetical protein